MRRLRSLVGPAVFLGGAGLYTVVVGLLGAPFDLTPLFIGAVAVAAGLVGARHQVIGTGLVLVGWGTAVLLVARGVVPPSRSTPAYMLGVGAGLVATAWLARGAGSRTRWLASGSVTALGAPLALYVSYDFAPLGHWPAWALSLVALAAWEAVQALRPHGFRVRWGR